MRLQNTPGSLRRCVGMIIAAVVALLAVGLGAGVASAAPVTGPALTLTPSDDLVTGDRITVTGAGFKKNTRLYVMETVRLPLTGIPLVHAGKKAVRTDAKGRFTTTLRAQERFGTVDCGKQRCFITAVAALPNGIVDRSQDSSAALRFRNGPGPRLVVAPKTGLRQGTLMTVTGTGFAKGSKLQVVQTVERPANGRPTKHTVPVPVIADPAGRFTTTIKATPKIGDVNCIKTACFVAAVPFDPAASARGQDAWTPITFDASDATALQIDAPQILQSDTARIRLTGGQPLDKYTIKVLGPDGFTAQPHVFADADGNATVLMMSDFDQALGDYTVNFTTERTGAVTSIKFSVSTNALFNPRQESGELITVPQDTPPDGSSPNAPVAQQSTGPEQSWFSIWLVVPIAVTVIGLAVLVWFVRHPKT